MKIAVIQPRASYYLGGTEKKNRCDINLLHC